MGGALSLIVAVIATILFFLLHRYAMAIVAAVVAIACLWSWLSMARFARMLARNRTYVEAINRGEIQEGTPEAEHFWNTGPFVVTDKDAMDIPNWIAFVNMLASVAALILLVWAAIAFLV